MGYQLHAEERFRFRENLFNNIRMELDQLKTCQSNSVFWGVAGASAVISILGAANLSAPESACFFLIPLLIVHPAWMIFFDKYRTIYRLSGFLRLQEKLALENPDLGLIGWESALETFWARQEEFQTNPQFIKDEESAIMSVPESRKRFTSHVYMWMVFFVFLLISLLALTLCALQISSPVVFLFAAIGISYVIWFAFDNYQKKNAQLLRSKQTKNWMEHALLTIFNLHQWMTSFFKERVSAGKTVEATDHAHQNKSDFTRSFRGFLDKLTSSQVVLLGVNSVLLIVLSLDFLFVHFQRTVFITLVNVIIFTVFLTFFILVFQITLYMFVNLIKGRYTVNAYESRWKNVLDVFQPVPLQV